MQWLTPKNPKYLMWVSRLFRQIFDSIIIEKFIDKQKKKTSWQSNTKQHPLILWTFIKILKILKRVDFFQMLNTEYFISPVSVKALAAH